MLFRRLPSPQKTETSIKISLKRASKGELWPHVGISEIKFNVMWCTRCLWNEALTTELSQLSEHEAQAGAISKETGDALPERPVSWQRALLYLVATTHHCLSKAGTCDFTTCQLSKAILGKELYIL